MDNLIFCLNATIPIFLTLLLGAFFRKVGLFTPDFVKQVNRFVFQGALPVLLFQDLGTSDFAGLWDGKFVLFCFLATFFSIVISIVISLFLKGRFPERGICPGFLSKQRRSFRHCFRGKCLRRLRYGPADDSRYRSSLQYHGCDCAFFLKARRQVH